MGRIVIKSEEGYLKVKQRVDDGIKYLEGKWGDPKYYKIIRGFDELALALYNYEVETGIFEKEFRAWQLKKYGKAL